MYAILNFNNYLTSMGNHFVSSRSKSRENKYKYPDNYEHTNSTSRNGVNQRVYSSQTNGYTHPQYSNGYGAQLINNTQNQYPTTQTHHHPHNNTNSNSNKVIYVANYDFTGTATSGELSFVKGDRLEILDRYT